MKFIIEQVIRRELLIPDDAKLSNGEKVDKSNITDYIDENIEKDASLAFQWEDYTIEESETL